ncbi:helix-turn-helix domain-containing protein [Vibrio ostreicida]|uniref:helix-turn-helix domain-containing protein n=1 Tax=Vibrio ostreicida TaxID=526588 RepID=UPI000970754C|nr:S24 family peptidase [Vibrio ostreicida]
MKEWYLSTELVGLDGMANSATGVSQKAKRNNWLSRRSASGSRALEYHISNFHPDVKRQVIEKYVTNPEEAKLLLVLEGSTEDIAQETSNVSKVMPMTEVKDWCELLVFDVHAAAGAGSLVHSEYQIDQLIIPTSLLAEFGLSQANASIIYVDGNSMEPTLSHKDRLLVDTRELQHPVTDGVYVIRIDDAVYVKRLKWNIPKGIYNVVSDNPAHESFEINHKNGRNFKIIGKAIAPVFKKIF